MCSKATAKTCQKKSVRIQCRSRFLGWGWLGVVLSETKKAFLKGFQFCLSLGKHIRFNVLWSFAAHVSHVAVPGVWREKGKITFNALWGSGDKGKVSHVTVSDIRIYGNGVTCNCFVLRCFVLLCFALHSPALICIESHCCALLYIALLCFAMLCFALHSFALH